MIVPTFRTAVEHGFSIPTPSNRGVRTVGLAVNRLFAYLALLWPLGPGNIQFPMDRITRRRPEERSVGIGLDRPLTCG